jgi:hypothetical protein
MSTRSRECSTAYFHFREVFRGTCSFECQQTSMPCRPLPRQRARCERHVTSGRYRNPSPLPPRYWRGANWGAGAYNRIGCIKIPPTRKHGAADLYITMHEPNVVQVSKPEHYLERYRTQNMFGDLNRILAHEDEQIFKASTIQKLQDEANLLRLVQEGCAIRAIYGDSICGEGCSLTAMKCHDGRGSHQQKQLHLFPEHSPLRIFIHIKALYHVL